MPRYHTSQHVLSFAGNKLLYEKGADISEKNTYYTDARTDDDIIYTDLSTKLFAKKQAVFETTVLISDSIQNIQWDMTNDTRVIAGFECHKATTILMDSVFVIAFYTDQLEISGGPIGLSGLPGMILGVAVPRLNMTIFATRIETTPPPATKFTRPIVKQQYDCKGFYQFIRTVSERMFYEEDAKKYVIKSLL